jgi:cyclopropane fatty-acyl-phospholipid synthase-like methyltransferase
MAGRTRPKPLTVLEWGSGGGCIAFAFRDVASKYFGVDISEKNLAECGRMLSAAGHSGLFCPVALSGEPHSIIEHVSQPIDLFISNAVFQHFPSREYGVSVLRAVRRLAGPGCVGAVQIRYDNGRRLYRGITRLSQYAKRHIVATSYPIEEFWRLLIETGWEPIGITRILAKNNEADFVFRAC